MSEVTTSLLGGLGMEAWYGNLGSNRGQTVTGSVNGRPSVLAR